MVFSAALATNQRQFTIPGSIALGCTELPLILRAEDAAVPLLDTLTLHVEAALDYALATA